MISGIGFIGLKDSDSKGPSSDLAPEPLLVAVGFLADLLLLFLLYLLELFGQDFGLPQFNINVLRQTVVKILVYGHLVERYVNCGGSR